MLSKYQLDAQCLHVFSHLSPKQDEREEMGEAAVTEFESLSFTRTQRHTHQDPFRSSPTPIFARQVLILLDSDEKHLLQEAFHNLPSGNYLLLPLSSHHTVPAPSLSGAVIKCQGSGSILSGSNSDSDSSKLCGLISACLGLPICKQGLVPYRPHRAIVRFKEISTYNALSTVPDTE